MLVLTPAPYNEPGYFSKGTFVSNSAVMTYPYSSLLGREIAQQPELWPDTLQRVQSFLAHGNVDFDRVIFTGAGTSAYAAQCVSDSWPGASAVPTTDLLLMSREEIECRVPGWSNGGLLISLARSGNSPESAGVVQRMQQLFPSVQHLAITCNADGRLTQINGVTVLALDDRTNDRSLAMTGSFSNLTLAGMALRHVDVLQQSVQSIAIATRHYLESMFAEVSQIASVGSSRFVVLTSTMHALAQEMVLKSLELTAGKTVGMAESFLAFRHGPISILQEDTPILCLLSSDPLKQKYEHDLLHELATRGAHNVCVLGEEQPEDVPFRWHIPALALSLPDALRAPFEVLPAQLLAYAHSVQAGIDPDDPSPDAQVTRVVRPFQLYI